MMLSTLLQCCIVIVMQIKLTVVVVVVVAVVVKDKSLEPETNPEKVAWPRNFNFTVLQKGKPSEEPNKQKA